MDLYTLDDRFHKTDLVDEFVSAVWTERYTKAGDVNLVVDASPEMVQKLKPGTFLGLAGTKEVMILETHELKDGLLTVTGPSLLEFLKNRLIRTVVRHAITTWYVEGKKPGELLAYLVQEMAINGAYLESNRFEDDPQINITNLYGPAEKIPNLFVNAIDHSGEVETVAVPFGPLYDALIQIAETNEIGMRMYLDRIDPFTDSGVIHFESYKGVDRTSEFSDDPVIFSPSLDNLNNLNEIHSIAGYKNVCYAFIPALSDESEDAQTLLAGIAWEGGSAWEGDPQHMDFFLGTTGFKRRTMMYMVDDLNVIPPEGVDLYDFLVNTLLPSLSQKARNALANNNYTRMVDGEVVPQSDYVFGVHYNLGDIVELRGLTGVKTAARVTEFTRAEDSGGTRSHPTVSVA